MKSGAENVLLKRILEQPKLENHIRFDKVMTGDQNETHSWKSEITEQVQVAPKSAATCEVTFKGSTAGNQSF
jgi:hypothetical protein